MMHFEDMKDFFEDMKDIFPLLWPVWLLGGIILFVFIWDEYDSYSECMYEWVEDRKDVEAFCPGCNDWQSNEWQKKDKEAHLRCLDYAQPWEW